MMFSEAKKWISEIDVPKTKYQYTLQILFWFQLKGKIPWESDYVYIHQYPRLIRRICCGNLTLFEKQSLCVKYVVAKVVISGYPYFNIYFATIDNFFIRHFCSIPLTINSCKEYEKVCPCSKIWISDWFCCLMPLQRDPITPQLSQSRFPLAHHTSMRSLLNDRASLRGSRYPPRLYGA